MERYLKTHIRTEKNLLFGFQVTAGKREAEHAICERAGAGTMDIGFLHAAVPAQLKRTMEQLVQGTGYRLRWHDDMESFFKCHVAAVLPLGYLGYVPRTAILGKPRRSSGGCAWTPPLRAMTCF